MKKYIKYVDRSGNEIVSSEHDTKSLRFLYHTFFGRCILFLLTRRIISKLVGLYMSTWISKIHIKSFIKKNRIDLSKCEKSKFKSYNDFFTRKLKPETIGINEDKNVFISPCDAKLTVYPITKELMVPIKNSIYSISSILKNKFLAEEYADGFCFVFRLTVSDYHRYCYIDDGTKKGNCFIKGVLHTVQPIATESRLVYHENCREYTILHTENFDSVVQIEVGAMCIGKIKNKHTEYAFKKGEEKGMFLFGGSTIVLLVKNNQIDIDSDILENTAEGLETVVKIGSQIGIKHKK